MKVVTAGEIKEIDNFTIEKLGIPGMILMDNAGRNIAEYIIKNFSKKNKIAIFIGKGNNGGDGLVVARYLYINNFNITIFLTFSPENFSTSPLLNMNFNICKNLDIPIVNFYNEDLINKNKNLLIDNDIIVDAILGTGIKSKLRTPIDKIVNLINSLGKYIISVDMPTGLYSDCSILPDIAIKANKTITFGLPKISQLLYPSKKNIGELSIINIGFPFQKINLDKIKINLIEKNLIKNSIPKRKKYYHKGDFGRISIFAGSKGKTGAAILTSKAAITSGAGLVTLICDKELNTIFETTLTEVMTEPVNLKKENEYSNTLELLKNSDVIVAGPGISTSQEAENYLHFILKLNNKVLILDADALNIIAKNLNLLKNSHNKIIITPHLGEFSRLTRLSIDEIMKNRLKIAKNFARKLNLILVLKSADTIIVDNNENIYINPIGNEGMATAGSGDVLTGIIAGIVAQNIKQKKDILTSVIASVYIHSLSGDYAKKEKGSFSLLASDIILNLKEAFNDILESDD